MAAALHEVGNHQLFALDLGPLVRTSWAGLHDMEWMMFGGTRVAKAVAHEYWIILRVVRFSRNEVSFYYWNHFEPNFYSQYPGVHDVTGCFPNGYCRGSEMNFQR